MLFLISANSVLLLGEANQKFKGLVLVLMQLVHNFGLFPFFENYQADNLRQQTLQQMQRILTTRQSARALLAINDYFSRLRALSSLWLARPRE